MPALNVRRIHLGTEGADEQLNVLRAQLSAQGNIVSARGRELTRKVFGEDLTPLQVVERICAEVQRRGVEAVFHYTEQFDHVRLTAATLRISRAEMALAHAAADPALLAAVKRIRQNILAFQTGILHRDA